MPFLSEAVEATWCYFFKNWFMKLKIYNLLKSLGTIIQQNYWSFYNSEPFTLACFNMRHLNFEFEIKPSNILWSLRKTTTAYRGEPSSWWNRISRTRDTLLNGLHERRHQSQELLRWTRMYFRTPVCRKPV